MVTMNGRRLKRRLNVLAAAMVAVAAATIGASVMTPYDRPRSAPTPVPTTRTAGKAAAADHVLSFEGIESLDLRRPLFDPSPLAVAATGPVSRPVNPLDLTLTGIIFEPDHAYAILVTAAGKTQVRAAGQRVGEAEITRIDAQGVTVRYRDQSVTLRVRKTNGGHGT